MWNEQYKSLTDRNLGILMEEEQDKIKNTKVAVAGLGGIGGPVCEILVRTGVENLNILDNGTYEPTNRNRQIFSFTDTNNKNKTDVTEEYLLKINPDTRIKKFLFLDENNINDFIRGVDIVVLAIDDLIPILLLSRKTHKLNITLIEAWAFLYGNVRVFNANTPSLEEVYKFPTMGKPISEITAEEQSKLLVDSIYQTINSMNGLFSEYPKRVFTRMNEKKEGSTVAPFVWLSCIMITIEILKIILNKGKLALAPNFVTFDPINYRLMY